MAGAKEFVILRGRTGADQIQADLRIQPGSMRQATDLGHLTSY
jgi:hypothetical protein